MARKCFSCFDRNKTNSLISNCDTDMPKKISLHYNSREMMNDLCRLCDQICGKIYMTSAIFMFYLTVVIFPLSLFIHFSFANLIKHFVKIRYDLLHCRYSCHYTDVNLAQTDETQYC